MNPPSPVHDAIVQLNALRVRNVPADLPVPHPAAALLAAQREDRER
jgi:hypothetical protein